MKENKKVRTKKKYREPIITGIVLLSLSLILFFIQTRVFNDLNKALSLLCSNIAFIPLNVFLTAFVIDTLFERRNKYHKIEKLIMIEGVFFSEFGTELLEKFARHDKNIKVLSDEAHINKNWGPSEFKKFNSVINNHQFDVDINTISLRKVSNIINDNKDFLISIITNPTLMEHELFSEMAVAIFHIREELQDIYVHTEYDTFNREHIKEDFSILYKLMTQTWIIYMKHLQEEYPTLFKKAMIHNPFHKRTINPNNPIKPLY